MRGKIVYHLITVFTILYSQHLFAQVQSEHPPETGTASSIVSEKPGEKAHTEFIIRSIIISGNKKTKPEIILRELPFKQGEKFFIGDLVKRFEAGRQQLMNTALFHEAVISLKNFEADQLDISVEVSERWYIFPLPFVKPVDRNLNQWLFEQKAKLNRTNYGAKILYNNITGHNDKFRLYLLTGYSRQVSLNYDNPFIDKSLKWGIKFSATLGKTRELNYATLNNKQLFVKDDKFLYHYFRNNVEISYRNALRTKHRLGINLVHENITDTVFALNPSYFPSGKKNMTYPEFYYMLQYFNLDYNPYPTKGYAAEFTLFKRGLNKTINLWQLSAKGLASWALNPKSFINVRGFASVKLPFKQPFTGLQMLGYSDAFLQGYEYYVIDGVAAAYLKAAFTRQLFHFNLKLPPNRFAENKKIPFRIYGKIFGNTGYVHHPSPGENRLSNRLLNSAGIGLDIVTFYDFTLKLEWTFNQLGQNGLFLHRRSTF